MMFTAYWEMQHNPFSKTMSCKHPFESEDFKQAAARLKYLCEIKGLGLFTGISGSGKTVAVKRFVDSLNPSLYKVFYLPLSTITVMEFYRAVALGLGVSPPHKKIDLFNAVQERMLSLSKERRITSLLICDEGQYLNTKILNDLKILFNFGMDTESHAAAAIVGQPVLANTLSMHTHEALAQRIVINYTFNGLGKAETADYISSRLKLCGVSANMFSESALEAVWGCCSGSLRVVNSLAEKCLLIGFQKGAKVVGPEIVMLANNEISLV
jgi:type II secretory pathway predicted ATPase ExeA